MMIFQSYYRKILKQQFNINYINQKIGIIAGNFRLPYKYDIQVVQELLSFCDKVVIIISNNSKQSILQRKVSTTNLDACSKILSKIQSTNTIVNKKIKQLKNKVQNLTYNQLQDILNEIIQNADSIQVREKLIKYLNTINSRLLNSIKFYNNIQLTGDYIKKIFQILFQNKSVDIVLSKQISPVIETINFVNDQCKDCTIYLTALNNFNDKSTTWQGLMDKFSSDNEIIQHYSKVKPDISRQIVLKKFNQLSDQKIFGNYIDKNNIIKIRNILNG